jgi:hypothetical protein
MAPSIATFLDDTYQSPDDVLKYLRTKTDGVDDEITGLLADVYQDLRLTIDTWNDKITMDTKIQVGAQIDGTTAPLINSLLPKLQKEGDDFTSDAVPKSLFTYRPRHNSATYPARLTTPPSQDRRSLRSSSSRSSRIMSSVESTPTRSGCSSITTYSRGSTSTPTPATSRKMNGRDLESVSAPLVDNCLVTTPPIVTRKSSLKVKRESFGLERHALPAVDEDEIFGSPPLLSLTLPPSLQVTDRPSSPTPSSLYNYRSQDLVMQSPTPVLPRSQKNSGIRRGASMMFKKAGHSVNLHLCRSARTLLTTLSRSCQIAFKSQETTHQ